MAGWRAVVRAVLFGAVRVGVVLSAAAMVGAGAARAQPGGDAGAAADVAAIRAAATAYREALAAGDAEAVKRAWTADGDIVDGWGNRLRPQDMAALDGGEADRGEPRPEFRTSETSLRFLTADVAVEDGTVDVVLPGMKTPIEGWFSALWVRSGASWKLAGLRESERPVAAGADMLEDLDWLVGDWVAEPGGDDEAAGADAAAEMSVRWDAGRMFLVRDFRVPAVADDGTAGVIEVHQRIGWDAVVRRIRSWTFSSDGSRAESTWFRDGDSWIEARTGILPDGRQDSALNIYSYDGRDRCVWRVMPDADALEAGPPSRATWVRRAEDTER
jgi:hypothetical protein